ncbi:unnamed protein product [Brassicogethes aeneus]|uniref:Ig-like domain-containing protein n=1 Tax=Brassicogethes aeneus TaxID=1431903 RepID=A0A9P0FA77_BRAAE|nr:unnamed protein product [Brassicogethes aeneus]
MFVTVRPKSVRILGNDGVSIKNSSVIGPKDEGTEIDLICEAIGGKPTPKVKWYNGTKEITRENEPSPSCYKKPLKALSM